MRADLGAGATNQERHTMSNTPSDDVLFELIKEHFDLDKRPFDTVIDRKTGRFHDAARYRDFASAVLARWGTPQPVVREPQCWCLTCRPMRVDDPESIRMALCPTCGNKRCPKANNHRNQCSNSNEPGQKGSAYEGCGITQKGGGEC